MPELTSISIHGFKSIASIDKLDLGPINVVIGPNGSGKSNFIGAFSLLQVYRDGRLADYVGAAGGANRLVHFGSKQTSQIIVMARFEDQNSEYSLSLAVSASDQLVLKSEHLHRIEAEEADYVKMHVSMGGRQAMVTSTNSSKLDAHMETHIEKWRLYHFQDTSSSSPMKKTADINDNRFLRPDGSNLAAFLYLLRVKHEASYNLIRRSVQLVAPFFDDFQLEPLNLNPNTIKLEWRHKNTDSYFDASSFSDGTLRFIALATLFLQPEELRPSVILVDEPELGLHPYAITLLASLIKQASVKTQVIVSTQSPQLLDNFEPEDVIVADLVDGATQLRRLDSEELASWLEEYSLGELWEKNQFGGRPGALS